MNRRGLLALLGGAVAMPAVGVKSAAAALGVPNVLNVEATSAEVGGLTPSLGGWWGSPLQIALDAKEASAREVQAGHAYPHMKSWGHAFRSMVVERDHLVLMTYRQKMQEDADFRAKVLAALGVTR